MTIKLTIIENIYKMLLLNIFLLFLFKMIYNAINSSTASVIYFSCSSSNSVCIGKDIT